MQYQKIINLLVNKPNQPSTFRTKYWVEKKRWLAWSVGHC